MPEGTACKNKREKTNQLKCRMKRFVRFLKHVRFVFFCLGYPFKCWSAVGQYIMSKACFPGECFSQWTVSSALKLGKARPVWSQTDNKIWKMKYPSRFQVAVRQRFTWDCKSQKNSNVGIYLGFPSLMLNPGVFQAKISRLLRQLTKPREKLAPSMEKKKETFFRNTDWNSAHDKEALPGTDERLDGQNVEARTLLEVRFHLLSTGARYFLTQPGSNPRLGNDGQVRLWSIVHQDLNLFKYPTKTKNSTMTL